LDESFEDMWHYHGKWFGAMWPSRGLTRGTLLLVMVVGFKILWGLWGSNPGPPIHTIAFANSVLPTYNTLILVIYMILYILKFICFMVGAGGRARA
jgi:hypothetical protein